MAIKDKEGNVYTLRGPNVLMRDQSEWDKKKITLINMNWEIEEVEDKKNPVKEFKSKVIDIKEELNLTKSVPIKQFIEEINEPEPEDIVVESNHSTHLLKERGAEFFCAPVVDKRTFVDNLYGSSYQNFVYGDKYLFDAIIIDQSDLELQFWCVREIAEGSIIYRKLKQGGERWWRVNTVEQKTGGYLAKAVTSDTNPDFS